MSWRVVEAVAFHVHLLRFFQWVKNMFTVCCSAHPMKILLAWGWSHISTYHRPLFLLPGKVWSSEHRNCLGVVFLPSIHTRCFRDLAILTLPWVLPVLFSLSLCPCRSSTGVSSFPPSHYKLSQLYAAFRVQLEHHHHETKKENFLPVKIKGPIRLFALCFSCCV